MNEQIHKLPNHIICFFTQVLNPFSVHWLFQVWGCSEEQCVISAHREPQVTSTQPVHISPAQDAGAIGGKRKRGEISGWVIWEGLAGKGLVPQERLSCPSHPHPRPPTTPLHGPEDSMLLP